MKPDSAPTSRRAPLAELLADPARRGLVEALIEARLLVTDRDAEGRPVVGVAHEALLRHWPRLREWAETDREFLRTRARVSAAAVRWREEGKTPDFLLSAGKPLAEAEDLLRLRRADLADDDAAFVEASARAARARSRRKIRVLAGVSVVLLALTVAAATAGWEARKQALAAGRALSASDLNEANRLLAADEPASALAYLARAVRSQPDHPAAASRLLSLLTYRNWFLPLTPPLRHEGEITDVAWSPDGSRLATSGADKTVRLWNPLTGEPASAAPLRHDAPVRALAWSPDGRTLLTGAEDRTARRWDAATGQPLGEPLAHPDEVSAVAWSPDGARFLTGGKDGAVRAWDAGTGRPAFDPLACGSLVRALLPSPDGKRLLTVANESVRVWDLATGRPLTGPVARAGMRTGFYTAGAWSPDGARVAVAFFGFRQENTQAYDVQLLDAATGQPQGEPLPTGGGVWSLAFHPDGRRLAAASFDGQPRVWDVATGQPAPGQPRRPHNGGVWSVAWSEDGRRLLTASADHTARLWDGATGEPLGEPLRHGDGLIRARFQPGGGTRVATVSLGGSARVWDVTPRRALPQELDNALPSVSSVAFRPDGAALATGDLVFPVARIWDPAGKLMREIAGHAGAVSHVAWSPDGRRLATASADKTAAVWDAATGARVGGPFTHAGEVNAVAWSPDGTRLLTASADRTARVWDPATGQPIGEPLRHDDPVRRAAWSPDGHRVLTVSGEEVRFWDAANGRPADSPSPLRHPAQNVQVAVWSPDGRRVATAAHDRIVRVWDAANGSLIHENIRQDAEIYALAYSPDGRTLATGATDRTVRWWDAATGRSVGETIEHGGKLVVWDVAFSPDGRRLAVACGAGELWDVPPVPPGVAPELLPALAEAVAGSRVNAEGAIVGHAGPDLDALTRLRRDALATGGPDVNGRDPLARWTRWFAGTNDPGTRTVSPLGDRTVAGFLRDAAAKNDVPTLTAALALAPGDATTLARLGQAETDADPARADRDTALALRWAPGNADVHAARAVVLREARRLPEALAAVERAIALDPRRGEFAHEQALVLRRLKRLPESIAASTRAVELTPGNVNFLGRRAFTHALAGEREAALADYARTVELDPKSVGTHFNYGKVLFVSGDPARALEQWQTAANLMNTPRLPAFLQAALAAGHWANGDRAKAMELYAGAVAREKGYAREDFIAGQPDELPAFTAVLQTLRAAAGGQNTRPGP